MEHRNPLRLRCRQSDRVRYLLRHRSRGAHGRGGLGPIRIDGISRFGTCRMAFSRTNVHIVCSDDQTRIAGLPRYTMKEFLKCGAY
jgi:hypothetical protein